MPSSQRDGCRLVSTPSHHGGLGSALASALPVARSPTLTTFTQQIALLVLNLLSPLRLPISPSGDNSNQHIRLHQGTHAIADDGTGWYTGKGVLFNHTIFGRDVAMISLWTMSLGPEFRDAARGTIHSLCKFQGLKKNDLNEEEPGRILNEYKPYKKTV